MIMLGVLGWSIDDAANLTLRQIADAYDARLLNEWDQTASVVCLLHNLAGIVISLGSKKRITPKSITSFHPYRKTKRTGMRIAAGDIKVLRLIGNALVKGRA